jgi:hypothetical protein
MHFVNVKNNKCLDVTGSRDAEGTAVIVWGRTSNANQRWDILYASDAKPEPTSGFSKEFGMHINRPFFLATGLPSGRYLDLIGDNIAIKTPNGFKTQQWTFDMKSRTIKSVSKSNQSIDGRSVNLRIYGTNSEYYQIFKF